GGNKLIDPPEGVASARQSQYMMVDKVEAPDRATLAFRLKFATNSFLPLPRSVDADLGPQCWKGLEIRVSRTCGIDLKLSSYLAFSEPPDFGTELVVPVRPVGHLTTSSSITRRNACRAEALVEKFG